FERIPLVHQQGLRVRSEGSGGLHIWSSRTGRHAVHLDERKIGRLKAVVIAGRESSGAFQAIDMQRGAPVGRVTADLRDKGRESGRIELHLQEGRACRRRILVGIGSAGSLRERTRITERHAEPERDLVLEGLARGQRALFRQGQGILNIVPRTWNLRVKLGGRFVVADIMAVVFKAIAVGASQVGTQRGGNKRPLPGGAVTVTVQSSLTREVCLCWRRIGLMGSAEQE